jgi:hypothetical protein
VDVRAAIEKHKPWVVAASIAVIAVCLFAARKAYRGEELPGAIDRVYFSDDEGKTYFAAGIENGVDFIHEGKHAYRAYIFRCDSGKPFVGYLGRRAGGHGDAAGATDSSQVGNSSAAAGGIEIRKPGEAKWVALNSVEGQAIVRSLCQSGNLDSVLP